MTGPAVLPREVRRTKLRKPHHPHAILHFRSHPVRRELLELRLAHRGVRALEVAARFYEHLLVFTIAPFCDVGLAPLSVLLDVRVLMLRVPGHLGVLGLRRFLTRPTLPAAPARAGWRALP